MHSADKRAQVLAALNERMSLRGTERAFHVARQIIACRLREAGDTVTDEEPPAPTATTALIVEPDEVWSFLYQCRAKVWVWVALDRVIRRVIAWVNEDRSEKQHSRSGQSFPNLSGAQPLLYRFLAGLCRSYPPDQHSACGKEQGQTNHSERWDNTLRQRVGRFVRQTFSFSTWERMRVAVLT